MDRHHATTSPFPVASRAAAPLVLVVDQSRTIGTLLHALLTDEGYRCLWLPPAYPGRVRRAAATLRPAAVLLDGSDGHRFGPPGRSRLSCTRKSRSCRCCSSPPTGTRSPRPKPSRRTLDARCASPASFPSPSRLTPCSVPWRGWLVKPRASAEHTPRYRRVLPAGRTNT
jgi:hypothetical protein